MRENENCFETVQVGGDDTPPGSPVRYLTTLSPVREGVPRRIIAVPGLRIFAPPGGGPTPSVLAVPGLTIYFPPREVEGAFGVPATCAKNCWPVVTGIDRLFTSFMRTRVRKSHTSQFHDSLFTTVRILCHTNWILPRSPGTVAGFRDCCQVLRAMPTAGSLPNMCKESARHVDPQPSMLGSQWTGTLLLPVWTTTHKKEGTNIQSNVNY